VYRHTSLMTSSSKKKKGYFGSSKSPQIQNPALSNPVCVCVCVCVCVPVCVYVCVCVCLGYSGPSRSSRSRTLPYHSVERERARARARRETERERERERERETYVLTPIQRLTFFGGILAEFPEVLCRCSKEGRISLHDHAPLRRLISLRGARFVTRTCSRNKKPHAHHDTRAW
jgi:hypothetical protein